MRTEAYLLSWKVDGSVFFFSFGVLRKPSRLLSFSELTLHFHFVLYKLRKRL